jgi:anti-sigma factor RsiW
VLVVVAGIVGAIAYFASRDSSTVSTSNEGPGRERAAGERPAVKTGNVLLLYSDPKLAQPLRALQGELAGGEEALAAAGQAVLVRRAPNQREPLRALSSGHRLDADRAHLAAVRSFVEYWLGRQTG